MDDKCLGDWHRMPDGVWMRDCEYRYVAERCAEGPWCWKASGLARGGGHYRRVYELRWVEDCWTSADEAQGFADELEEYLTENEGAGDPWG